MNELTIKAVLTESPYLYEEFYIKVTEENYRLVRKKLEYEKAKIISYLNKFKDAGIIKAINKPRNKRLQKELNVLINLKKDINKSIQQIKEFFYK